jgi:hypothetical protein
MAVAPKKKTAKQRVVPDEVKGYIAAKFGAYTPSREVQAEVKEIFGLDLTRNYLRTFNIDDPTMSVRMGKRWRIVGEEARKAFIEETAKNPAYHRAFRIERLATMADQAYQMRNFPLAARLYEQIAREAGDNFTNAVQIKGRVAHDHQHQHQLHEMPPTIEEKRNVLSDRLREALDRHVSSNQSVH